MSAIRKPIYIVKTEGEWNVINRRLGGRKLYNFIQSEARALIESYAKTPENVSMAAGDKIHKRPYIDGDQYEKLECIANQMKIPVSSVIDIFIIQPLLKPNQ